MKFLAILAVLCVSALGTSIPRLNDRIVGGEETTIEKYPYQVSVRIYDIHICGGSIIDETTVLTAAHCTFGINHDEFSVRVGATNHQEGQRIRVTSVRQHENYNDNTIENDMSILKLERSLVFSKSIQLIALQSKGVTVAAGTTAYISGWGILYDGSDTTPDSLRAVDVAVITVDECIKKYGDGYIFPNMMCAQTLNHDSCKQDSGGPLAANGKLIGVVSWGIGCADPKYPGVYADVSTMYDWIIKHKY